MVDCAALDKRKNRIAIAFGITQPFEQHHAAALAPPIAIGGCGKGFAATIGSQGLHLREGNMTSW